MHKPPLHFPLQSPSATPKPLRTAVEPNNTLPRKINQAYDSSNEPEHPRTPQTNNQDIKSLTLMG